MILDPTPEELARYAALRARMIETGQVIPGEPGPKYMTHDQVEEWKKKMRRLKIWTPVLLRAVPLTRIMQ